MSWLYRAINLITFSVTSVAMLLSRGYFLSFWKYPQVFVALVSLPVLLEWTRCILRVFVFYLPYQMCGIKCSSFVSPPRETVILQILYVTIGLLSISKFKSFPSIYPSIHLSIYPSIHLSTYLSDPWWECNVRFRSRVWYHVIRSSLVNLHDLWFIPICLCAFSMNVCLLISRIWIIQSFRHKH